MRFLKNSHIVLIIMAAGMLGIAQYSQAAVSAYPLESKILIIEGPDPQLESEIVEFKVPKKVVPGRTYWVTVTFKNKGKATWTTKDEYRLGVKDENSSFGNLRFEIVAGRQIKPNMRYTFKFPLKVPKKAGTYMEEFEMVKERVAWFGDKLEIKVKID